MKSHSLDDQVGPEVDLAVPRLWVQLLGSQRCKKVQKEKLIQKQIQHTNLNKSKELIKRGWFGLLWLDEEKVF